MSKLLPYAALAAVLTVAGPALAQSAGSHAATSPQATPPTTSSPSTATPGSTSAAPPTTSAPSSAAPGAAPSTSTAPASTTPPSSAATGAGADTSANAGASADVASGMSVKDNTGALIGEVKSIKGGLATISMGSDTFTVDSNKLGVENGAATINATQAEIRKMLPKK